MNDIYRLLRDNSTGGIRAGLTQQQRAWVAQRDHVCGAAPSPDCLTPLYQRRLDMFKALRSALDADPEGVLRSLHPLIFTGRWTAAPIDLKPDEARQVVSTEIDKKLYEWRLPHPGETIDADAEGLRYGDDVRTPISWSRNTVASLEGSRKIQTQLGLEPTQEVMVGIGSSKQDEPINLVIGQGGAVGAILPVCARSGDCWFNLQHWSPVPPPAESTGHIR